MSKFVFTNASNRSSSDRFIPNRSNANLEMAHFKLLSVDNNNGTSKIDIFNLKETQINKYKEMLQTTFNYQDTPIFSYKNKPNTQKKPDKSSSSNICQEWPCIPRKYPLIIKPEILLDWPNVHSDIHWNIVDWSSTGYMATIWSDEVFLWRNKQNRNEEVTETNIKGFGALRWNRAGTQLAVGEIRGKLTVWALPEKKLLYSCRCDWLNPCTISCVLWDLTDTILVSGCSEGHLSKWGPKGEALDCVQAHDCHRIVSLAFDASNKFLCSSGTDGLVRLWNWPTCEPHVEVDYSSPIRAIAFHPWRPALLAVGGGLGDGSITIWNVNTCRQLGYLLPERNSLVDCLSWNRITGELVTSHQLLTGNRSDMSESLGGDVLEGAETKVMVLAGLNKVVDCVDDPVGRVLYLMWNRTGTQLAMGCSDECLCIYNFLGHPSKNKIDYQKKYVRQSKRSVLSNFEKCIR